MKNSPKHISLFVSLAVVAMALLLPLSLIAQEAPVVTTTIDTTSIRLGEQINYTVTVETDQLATVIFPEGQTFSPLEMIESYKVDTAFAKAKMTLVKKYGLTQFDSGSYSIPRQRILIGDRTIQTDSFRVDVANVKLDTVNQGLFDIKPAIEIPKNYGKIILNLLAWLLPIALAIGLFLYWLLSRHKKRKEAEKYVAPFDKALASLKALDTKELIASSKYKEYYTTLTDTLRRYYDEKVYNRALESTTDELIDRLNVEKDSGHINFNSETIAHIKDIFKRADLVKFARINPPEGKAQADRLAVEQIVKETKEALPPPTVEELMKDELYREQLERKRNRKLWLTGIAGVAGILLVALVAGIAIKGVSEVKDFVLGNATRELAESQWITSEYGYPSMIVSSPKPLERGTITLPGQENAQQSKTTSFSWQTTPLAINATITQLQLPSKDAIDLEVIVDNNLKGIEALGFNIGLVKNDPYKTLNGAEGLKTFGSGNFSLPKREEKINIEYASLVFQAETIIQVFTVIWQSDDPYATKIANRMIDSVELQAPKQEE